MATTKTQDALIHLSKWVASECNIANIIESNNRGLSAEDYAYTLPVDNNSSFGRLRDLGFNKAGYGTRLTVQQDSQRTAVVNKVWNVISSKKDRIIKKYKDFLAEQNINVDILSLDFGRYTTYSDGSQSILMQIQEYKVDGTPYLSGGAPRLSTGFVIFAKGLRQDKGDPHELMTGTLIAMGKIIDVNSINRKGIEKRNDELEKTGDVIYANYGRVVGAKDKEAKLIKGDVVNLAKAISVSNYVNTLMSRNNARNVRVYQTGAKWHSDVTKFKGKDRSRDTIIKAYNSADLIVRFNLGSATHHWGLSLKKKGIALNEADPTLLNKPVVGEGSASGKKTAGYLYLKATTSQRNALVTAEDTFWREVYRVRFNKTAPKTGTGWKKNLNDALAGNEKKAALTGGRGTLRETKDFKYPQNTFFLAIDNIFKKVMQDPNNFKEFLDLCFRINIDEYVKQENFHFSLITGSGGLTPDGKLVVKNPNEKNSVFLKQIFNYMFQGGKSSVRDLNAQFRVDPTKNKIQAFDSQGRATAAKLFYTMWIRSMPIVDLEVRYKGSITVNPQFQVFITKRFGNFLGRAQTKMKNLGIHAYLK